jgi:hypothetical protein
VVKTLEKFQTNNFSKVSNCGKDIGKVSNCGKDIGKV